MTERVASGEDKELVGAAQIDALLCDDALPFANQLCVEVGDIGYSKPEYLHSNRRHKNLVSIARVRSNRIVYRQANAEEHPPRRGHPTWYGDAFSLKDSTTWQPADATTTLSQGSRRGKQYQVEIRAWHNLLIRGKQQPQQLPMHEHPFTLVCITRFNLSKVQNVALLLATYHFAKQSIYSSRRRQFMSEIIVSRCRYGRIST